MVEAVTIDEKLSLALLDKHVIVHYYNTLKIF